MNKSIKTLSVATLASISLLVANTAHADNINGVQINSNDGHTITLADGEKVYKDGDHWYLNGTEVVIAPDAIPTKTPTPQPQPEPQEPTKAPIATPQQTPQPTQKTPQAPTIAVPTKTPNEPAKPLEPKTPQAPKQETPTKVPNTPTQPAEPKTPQAPTIATPTKTPSEPNVPTTVSTTVPIKPGTTQPDQVGQVINPTEIDEHTTTIDKGLPPIEPTKGGKTNEVDKVATSAPSHPSALVHNATTQKDQPQLGAGEQKGKEVSKQVNPGTTTIKGEGTHKDIISPEGKYVGQEKEPLKTQTTSSQATLPKTGEDNLTGTLMTIAGGFILLALGAFGLLTALSGKRGKHGK